MNQRNDAPVFLTVNQVASIECTSTRTVQDRCKKQKYTFETVFANGGQQYRIHLSSLTTAAQIKYYIWLSHDSVLPTATRDEKCAWFDSLKLEPDVYMQVYRAMGLHIEPEAWTVEVSEKRHEALFHMKTFAKETARDRAQLVRGFVAAKRRATGNITQAAHDYADSVGQSYATLARWYKEVKHLQQQDWEPALVPGWKGGRKKVDIHPAVWETIASRYLVVSKPTAKSVYQHACRWAEQRGYDVPSYRIVLARLTGIDRQVRILRREGESALDKTIPGIVRDWSTIDLHEVWNADGRKADVFCIWPDGYVDRPVVVDWLDMRSRMFLGAAFDKGENVDLVRKSFRAAVEFTGCIPSEAYLDNGAAFASKEFTGGQAKRNRFKVKETEITGILTLMGVRATWATPGRGQVKPVESNHNVFARGVDQRAEFVKAYCGKDTVSRPEGNNPKQHPIPIADYMAAYMEEAEVYNMRPHRGIGMDGKSPMQVYNELRDITIARKPTKEQMAWCMLVAQPVMLSQRDGSFTINGNVYWHAALPKLASTGPYTARYDADDSTVPVQLFDGETCVCERAELRLRTGARNLAAAKDGIRAKKQAKRAVKDLAKAHEAQRQAASWATQNPPAAPGTPVLPAAKVVKPMRPTKNLKPGKPEPLPVAKVTHGPTPAMLENRARKIAAMAGSY
jgi:hypothetical protein